MLLPLLVLGMLQPPDTAELRRAARSAEAEYERTARWMSPTTFGRGAHDCLEIVGRFCLTFDSLSKPPARPVRPEVGVARARAIDAARVYARYAPAALNAAGPLVRLLIEDGRALEAVVAAQRFAEQTDSELWREWLPGYALHAAGSDSAAAVRFERALSLLEEPQREEILSIEWLIDPAERRALERLDSAGRATYHRRFWSMADPMLATEVNEAFVQHVARHVEAQLRADIPRVPGMESWGRDLHQLLVRYGAPVARERVIGRISDPESFIEHFDSTALSFMPRALLGNGGAPPEPGERWALDDPAPRSAHAIPALRSVVPLPHQLVRYPRGDSMLVRVHGAVADSGALVASLFAVGLDGVTIASTRSPANANFTVELLLPRDTAVYGVEAFREATRHLARARYELEPLTRNTVELSDLLLTRGGEPLTSFELEPDAAVSLQAELHGLRPETPYEVVAGFAAVERASALERGIAWLGRQLGVITESAPARVRWQDHAQAAGLLELDVRVPSKPGLYALEVRIRAGADEAVARRLIRVRDPDVP